LSPKTKRAFGSTRNMSRVIQSRYFTGMALFPVEKLEDGGSRCRW
jgi:hypothetical protein